MDNLTKASAVLKQLGKNIMARKRKNVVAQMKPKANTSELQRLIDAGVIKPELITRFMKNLRP